jgi:hypothetical protein
VNDIVIRTRGLVVVLCVLLGAAAPAMAETSLDVLLGFNGGTGGQVGFKWAPIQPHLPWGARVSAAYIRGDGGDGSTAYALWTGVTPGTNPDEEATTWSFRLDANYRFRNRSFSELSVFGGLRHARFTAEFTERATSSLLKIESAPWGLGAGLEADYEFGSSSDLVVVVGLDYYFKAALKGDNDVTFEPGQETGGVSYDEADKAVGQPRLELLVMAGLSFRFGG